MRCVIASVLLLLTCLGCGDKEKLVGVEFLDMTDDVEDLDLKEVPVYRRQWSYRLRLHSKAKHAVRFGVRLDAPRGRGVRVRLTGETRLLPEGSSLARLVFVPPQGTGPFEGTVTIFSDDVPGWSRSLSFRGTVVDKLFEGRHLVLEPSPVELGNMFPLSVREFEVTARAAGTQSVTISKWELPDAGGVELDLDDGGLSIEPGETLSITGRVTAPRPGGPFSRRIRLHTDAENAPVRDLLLTGRVAAEHVAEPEVLRWEAVYAPQRPSIKVRLRSSETVAPFTLESVRNAEPYFEVVERGSREPAREQEVLLRLKSDAPEGPARFVITFHLAPSGAEVLWPVQMRVVPSVLAQPSQVVFGRVRANANARQEVRLASFSGRAFTVTSAGSEQGYFLVETRHARGMPWRIIVRLPDGVRPGVYRDRIRIDTDDAETPRVVIPVIAEVIP